MKWYWVLGPVALGALGVGCGKSNNCQLSNPSSCSNGQVCEAVLGGTPKCFEPVQIQGQVFDLSSKAGISNARVAALDINGAPLGTAATSSSNGDYTLQIPSTRTDAGAPIGTEVQLSAQAQNYAPFPGGIRVSIPIDTTGVTSSGSGKPYLVDSGLTNIGLEVLPASEQGRPSVSGTAQTDGGQSGTIVSLDISDGGTGGTAIADRHGDFTVFNVAPGTYSAEAYSPGINYTAVPVTVTQGQNVTGVQIKAAAGASTATLSGNVQIVATGSNGTSVVLVLESTFDPVIARGTVVPGLRDPAPGTPPNVTGPFTIAGIPDGKYVVLAAFENDGLVRDPDPNIAGTQIQHITVSGGQVTAAPSFKVTGAVLLVSPGAGDTVDVVSSMPTFAWTAYPSTTFYQVTLFDAFGNIVWGPTTTTNTSITYNGAALMSGATYQWRVVAYNRSAVPISTSEDLRGIFEVQ